MASDDETWKTHFVDKKSSKCFEQNFLGYLLCLLYATMSTFVYVYYISKCCHHKTKFGTNQLRQYTAVISTHHQFQIKTYNYPHKTIQSTTKQYPKQMASLNIVLSLNKLFAFRLWKLRKRTKLKHKIASEWRTNVHSSRYRHYIALNIFVSFQKSGFTLTFLRPPTVYLKLKLGNKIVPLVSHFTSLSCLCVLYCTLCCIVCSYSVWYSCLLCALFWIYVWQKGVKECCMLTMNWSVLGYFSFLL